VLPSYNVKVAPVAGAVNATLLIEVAIATPRVGVTRVGLEARTTAPEPVVEVIEVPLILKLLPVPAVSNVLLVNVSVVARPTKVSLEVGRVNVPLLTKVEKLGDVSDGLVAKTAAPEPVSSETAVANCADVIVMVLEPKLIVLLVSVSVVALPTKVSVAAGRVNVPEAVPEATKVVVPEVEPEK